ncbi:MAG: hexameric tyrosine-coordinated heme protein [Geminicoccaceae bacterium]
MAPDIVTDGIATLVTLTTEDSDALALKLSRMAVDPAQSDTKLCDRSGPIYALDALALIAITGGHTRYLAVANDYGRKTA